jgi:hypothetical protein
MLSGSKIVFDEVIHGTAATYTAYQLADEIGTPDRLAIEAVADTVTGTSPTLTVAIEHSGDGRSWVQKNGAAEINAVSLSLTQTTPAMGGDTGATPSSAFVRLRIQLGGTGTVMAHVRITLATRDRRGLRSTSRDPAAVAAALSNGPIAASAFPGSSVIVPGSGVKAVAAVSDTYGIPWPPRAAGR